jgi:sRNA-binding protein
MDVSEDGTVTGSIDVAGLNAVKPKTDEAKAQIKNLKAAAQAGQEQAVADAEERFAAPQEPDSDDKAPAKKPAASRSTTEKG